MFISCLLLIVCFVIVFFILIWHNSLSFFPNVITRKHEFNHRTDPFVHWDDNNPNDDFNCHAHFG